MKTINLKLFLVALFFTNLNACIDGQYGSSYPSSNYPYPYPNYPTNNYPSYPNTNYPPPVYYPPPNNPYRYPHQHDNQGGSWNDRNRHNPPPAVAAPTPAPAPVIRPNCPSGTNFTGNSCVITDPKLRRPGGDGRINPCPSGMWVSGDRCVGR